MSLNETIAKYLEGTLTPPEKEKFEEKLLVDPYLQNEFDLRQKLYKLECNDVGLKINT